MEVKYATIRLVSSCNCRRGVVIVVVRRVRVVVLTNAARRGCDGRHKRMVEK